MWIPGFGNDELRPFKKQATTEAHKQVCTRGAIFRTEQILFDILARVIPSASVGASTIQVRLHSIEE